MDFLRAINDEKVAFYFKDPHSAGELRPAADGDYKYRYVVMPMRI